MNSVLYSIVAIVLVVLVLKLASKIVYKILGIAVVSIVVLGFLYQQGLGPFKSNVVSIDQLTQKYCLSGQYDEEYCSCIVKPIVADIERRFTPNELKELESERLKSFYIFRKSLKAEKENIQSCLKSKGKEESYNAFVGSLTGIPEGWLSTLDNVGDSIKNKTNEEFERILKEQKEINEKYE